MDNIKIGIAISKLRKRQGYTQKQLADKLNVSDKAVSKWERGQGLPDISILSTLAMVLDSDIESLLEGHATSSTKEKWIGLLDLSNTNIDLNSIICDKTLITYLLGYFMLAGIKDIYINKEIDFDIPSELMNSKVSIHSVSNIKDIQNNNVMVINNPIFIYGQNLTRSFQKATERKDGINILSLSEHKDNNISIMFDSNHKVVNNIDDAMDTAYNFNALPIVFYPKQFANMIIDGDLKNIIDELLDKSVLYTEPMLRGLIYIPINNNEDINDASKIVEIVQKRDHSIGDIDEICLKRGLK